MRTLAPHRDRHTRKGLTVALPPQPAPFLSVAESNTWLAVRADISEAFETIEERHQNVLRLRYNSINTTLEQVGSELNISPDAARKRVDRAIQAMIDELGGKRPYTEYDHGNPEE